MVTSTNGGGSDGAGDSTAAGASGSGSATANASGSGSAGGGNNNRVGVRLDAPYSGKVDRQTDTSLYFYHYNKAQGLLIVFIIHTSVYVSVIVVWS